jgi:hypothetical protein
LALVAIMAAAPAALLFARSERAVDFQPNLDTVLERDLHFSQAELVNLERGKIAEHIIPPATPEEVALAGAVRIQGSRERFVAAYRDIVAFEKSPAVMAIGRFSTPPDSADLAPLMTNHDDFDLRGCKIADCDIRLPASEIERIGANVDWHRPDADIRAAALFKQILLTHVRAYTTGGLGRMMQYDDGKMPVRPSEATEDLIRTSRFLETLHPGLAAHILCYWSTPLEGAEDFLYWTKQTFGLSPFVSVTHVTILPSGRHQSLATNRDVYSSRYIDGSLSMMIASDSVGDSRAFYLFYVNRSRASALRGPLGGLRRAIIEHKAKGALHGYLRDIKARYEVH